MAQERYRPTRFCEVCEGEYRAHPRVRTCSRACGIVLRGRSRAATFERDRATGKLKGRYVDNKGYVRVLVEPGKWMLEHRHVLGRHLGRPLERHESVHHRNGDRQDNDLANLELRVGGHGNGATSPHCRTCSCFNSCEEG